MAKQIKIQDPKRLRWFQMAHQYGQTHESWAKIQKGSEEHKAWIAYFGTLGWAPTTLREIEKNHDQCWTAPCQWPDALTKDLLL